MVLPLYRLGCSMKILLFLSLLLSVQGAWADKIPPGKFSTYSEAQERDIIKSTDVLFTDFDWDRWFREEEKVQTARQEREAGSRIPLSSESAIILEREAAEREQRSKPYEKPLMFPVDDFMVINSTEIYDHWIIFKGTESFTLSDFVKDGKFCAWRGGHRWISWNEWDDAILWTKISMGFQKYPCANLEDFCVICGRCRRKIKVSKEVEELEP